MLGQTAVQFNGILLWHFYLSVKLTQSVTRMALSISPWRKGVSTIAVAGNI